MTRHKDRKARIRAQMAATGEPYSIAAGAVDAAREQLADPALAPGRPDVGLTAALSEGIIQPVPLPDNVTCAVP